MVKPKFCLSQENLNLQIAEKETALLRTMSISNGIRHAIKNMYPRNPTFYHHSAIIEKNVTKAFIKPTVNAYVVRY